MSNRVYQYYKDLPPWAKGATVVGGMAIVYFTSRQVYNGIKKIVDNKKQLLSVDAAKTDITNLSKQGIDPSYPDSQFKLWADKLQSTFDGCDISIGAGSWIYTASGQAVYDIISQLKNNSDFLKLITGYGVRTYSACLSWFNSSKAMTLPQAVADKLSSSEIEGINAQLAKQGITYTF